MEEDVYEQIEDICERLKAQKGEAIMIVNDGISGNTLCSVHCFNKDTAFGLLLRFFQCNPNLIPEALHAIGMALSPEESESYEDYDPDEDDIEDSDIICMN